MLGDLLLNISASIIYDFGKAIKSQAAKTETVQTVLKQLGASPSLHDFPDRYVEALVEFRFMDKNKVILDFFREESIANTFFNFYYGDASKKGKESALWLDIEHFIESLKVGDDVKAHDVNVENEVKAFWEVFKQKINQSRTVKEVELEQALGLLKNRMNDIQEMLISFQNMMKEKGKTDIQIADKIYNIDKIDTAFFGRLLNKTPRFLTNQPLKADYFIGRDDDLKTIETHYQEHNRLLVLVNGEGGIGKTTLAAQYWYAHQERYKHLAWLYTERGIGTALVSLAPQLGITFTPDDDEAAQIERITEGVNNLEMPCLLVFDNANDVLDVKKHYATLRKLGNCHIVLTSRINQAIGMKPFKVKPLDKPYAIRLFSHHYPSFDSQEADILEGICVAVGYNTLVLELLAKNLTVANEIRKHYTLSDLLADLQKKGLLAIKARQVDATVGNTNYVETPVDSIISAMYDLSALSHEEQYLLSNFAVLPAENIAIDILTDLLKPDDLEVFDTTLSSLNKKGWIEFQEKDSSFKIIPVIQEITRKKNENRLLADCNTLINVLIEGLNNDNRHTDNYKQATIFAHLGESIIHAIPMPDDDIAILCQNIGNFYKDMGNLYLMRQSYQKMVDILNTLCTSKPDNFHFKNGLAIAYKKLGDTYFRLGNLNKALILFEYGKTILEQLHTSNEKNIEFKNGLAILYERLGDTYINLDKLDKALNCFERYHNLQKELIEIDSNNVLFKNNLAISYEKLGDINELHGFWSNALEFFEKEKDLFEELNFSSPQNLDFKNGLAISYSKLGDAHSKLGNFDKALEFFQQRNKLSEELHTTYPNNADFKNGLAISYSKLGSTHSSLGYLDKALEFLTQRNKLSEELYTDYPNNIDFKNGLAVSYCKLAEISKKKKDNKKAKTYYQEAENCGSNWCVMHLSMCSFRSF